MASYQIVIPTRVYFGKNIWREALKAQEDLLQGNVLLVTTGRSLYRLGYVEELQQELQKYPRVHNICIFDQVSANPRLSEVQKGISEGRRESIDVIVGFGGGSALDAAKAIAVGVRAEKSIEDLFRQGIEPGSEALPIIAIPTTAGTGSELSKAAILTDEMQKTKNGLRGKALYPKLAIVDSSFTESVPLQTTMETGFDVLAHAVESYISKASSPYTRMQSETAVQIVGRYLPRLKKCLTDIESREQMSFASMLMGINLGNASTCLPHRLQYPLGAYTDSSHGAGLAALFTAWISLEYQYRPDDIEKMLTLLTERRVQGERDCVETIYQFIQSLGLKVSLQEMGICEEQISILTKNVSGNVKNDPAAEEEGIIRKIYERAWRGKNICRQS